jgi:hypothetical protein
MKVEDLRQQGTGSQLHLHEKSGKEHKMLCHRALSEMLHAYIAAAGITDDRKGWLFRTSPRLNADVLTEQPMDQRRMAHASQARRRRRRYCGNSATTPAARLGITNFLENGGSLEIAQDMAAHHQALRPWEKPAQAG